MTALLGIFSFSFLVALTGAMSPGPLLTYTIARSAGAGRRGYLMGIWIVSGHAVVELVIVIILISGCSFILENLYVMRAVGVIGGVVLVGFGAGILKHVRDGRTSADFLNMPDGPALTGISASGPRVLKYPVIGGMLVSMSNPYWWIWWATIGLAFMIQFDISAANPPSLVAFFAGHEAGDFAWYLLVSVTAFFGLRRLSRRVYDAVFVICGVFMIGFGIYLGGSLFFRPAII